MILRHKILLFPTSSGVSEASSASERANGLTSGLFFILAHSELIQNWLAWLIDD